MAVPAAPISGERTFSDLAGWDADDLEEACAAMRLGDPTVPRGDARRWFETTYTLGQAIDGHFTGYYEPQIDGSLQASAAFPVPLHGCPGDGPYPPRARIEPVLAGHEVAWVRDEVDRFFLQVQGSGRIRLADGSVLRLGHDGRNGHPYVSIGRLLVERGVFGPDITAAALKAWLRADPDRGRALMDENPSYAMFRRTDGAGGPMGTLCPVTALRSIAVDPAHTPLGTPVWIEVAGHARLCIAQDTGSAIVGPGRADLFFGTGDAAEAAAGALNEAGRFIPLLRR